MRQSILATSCNHGGGINRTTASSTEESDWPKTKHLGKWIKVSLNPEIKPLTLPWSYTI